MTPSRFAAVVAIALWSSGPLRAQAPARPAVSAWDGVYTTGQAVRGADVVGMCVSCHGVDLDGVGGHAPILVGPAFLARWQDWTLGDVFERIVSEIQVLTRPAAGSAGAREDTGGPQRLQQSADVLAYILRENRVPAGQLELPPDIDALRRIHVSKR